MVIFTKGKQFLKYISVISLCMSTVVTFAQIRWQSVDVIHFRSLNAIKFIDVNTDIVVGGIQATNAIARYTNRGTESSNYLDFDTTQLRFTDVSFPIHDIGYTVGWGGAILKSVNMSDSWYYLTRYLPASVSDKDFNGTWFINANEGYVVGGNNDSVQTIIKTTDGGYTWSVQRNGAGHWLTSVCFISSSIGFAVGKGGTILKTTNGGVSWNTVAVSGVAGTRDYNKIVFLNATTGFIVGGSETNVQTILKTTDGGNNWSTIEDVVGEPMLNGIAFKDGNNGFAVGNKGVIKSTSDIGNTWTSFILPDSINDSIRNLKGVGFFGKYSGGFVGESGKYFVYSDTIPPAPSVTTDSSVVNLDNTVKLYGSVNANSGITHATFEYGLTSALGSVLNVLPDSITGAVFKSVSVTTPTLPTGIYSYRVRASSPGGDSVGIIKTFSIGIPTVKTGNILIDATNKVKISGTVNPNGGSSTVSFEYGTTTAFGNVIHVSSNPITGFGNQSVSVTTPILADGIYYYRIYATSSVGNDSGEIKQFYLGPNPIPNFDFENWKTDTLTVFQGWVTQSPLAGISYDGSKSAVLTGQNKDSLGIILDGGFGQDGPNGGVPFTARPDSVVAYFNYSVRPDVPAYFGVLFKKDGNVFAQFPFQIGDSTHYSSNGQFERFSFPLSYPDSTTYPDSIIVLFITCDIFGGHAPSSTNVLEIDNISFPGTTQNVPNPGFETWAQILNEYPVSWNIHREDPYMPAQITKTTDASHGHYAVRMQNDTSMNSASRLETIKPNNNNNDYASFPVNQRYPALYGDYKFYPVNGDTAVVEVQMFKNGNVIGSASLVFFDKDTVYKPFIDTIFYFNNTDIPDSASITVTTVNSYDYSVKGNSTLYLDNFSFDANHTSDTLVVTGVKSNLADVKSLKLYPNPASNYIAVQLPQNEDIVEITIFDLNGNNIHAANIENAYKDVQMFNVSDLSSGIYLLRIQTMNSTYTNKFVISK